MWFSARLALLCVALCFLLQTVYGTIESNFTESPTLILVVDPPDGHSSPAALGVFARANDPDAIVYYDLYGNSPTFGPYNRTYESPFIQLDTPFQASRNRTIAMIAYLETENEDGTITIVRSKLIRRNYFVEGAARENSFGFLVPGVESGGFFIKFGLEIAAQARAQVAGGQEFANFSSRLGIGTYDVQVAALNLVSLDPDLTGFEGGFPVNTSDNKYYGFLIPFHNGEYPLARGFRKGFMEYPYGYLSAGHYSTVARLDLENFRLSTSRLVDLALVDRTYGGYSGGFQDGTWSCFNPYLTYAGPIGGIRSSLQVDANHLRPYYYASMLCLNASAWNTPNNETEALQGMIRIIDFSTIEDTLRGFSEAIRIGRFAFLSPLQSAEGVYSSKLIRISLGDTDIGTTLTALAATSTNVRTIVDILDLSKKSTALAGFSGLFTSGQFLFLVPFRNTYEPSNGQRGHGTLVRLDLNRFSLNGVIYLDMPSTTRTQVPSFADFKMRGYWGGFASGHYGVLVPFYNADFHGIVARVKTMDPTLGTNLQELDLMVDYARPNVYKGYRGGFVSLWQGVDESELNN
eukprot:gene11343-13192_t